MMSTKTTTQPAAPSAEEKALQVKQLELATFQLTELQKQSALQEQFAADIGPLLEQQTADAQLARERGEALFPIQEELLQLALEDIRRGGAATPEQIGLIEEAGSAALERGNIDIGRFETQGLEGLREELAPSLGLRPSDTPILDRGGRLAAEALRQRGQLSQGIRGAEATARLNFPLAQSELLQQSIFGQQRLTEATRQFQDGLRQAAFVNRLNLQSNVGDLGLGLASAPTVQFPGFARGSTSTTSDPLDTAGKVATGIGAVLAFSSRDLKTDKTPVDEDRILEKVEKLPVEHWKYKNSLGLGDAYHVGTFAEDFAESFGGDGVTLNLMDITGVLTASVKSLSKKVKKLEGLSLVANENSRGLGLTVGKSNGTLGLAAAA